MICLRGSINIDVKTLSPNSSLVTINYFGKVVMYYQICQLFEKFWNVQHWQKKKQHTHFSSLKNKSSVRFHLQSESVHKPLCFFQLERFYFPLSLKTTNTIIASERERKEQSTWNNRSTFLCNWSNKQDDLLVLVATYKPALNSCCWARQGRKTSVSGVLTIVDACFAWNKKSVCFLMISS